ncbi:MAG: GNAT family N-acetyltransferase [Treponema sp.]|jgi:predicted N-acetyltransferase YhbS|nr:GNAT family N-acetyltransferase [Treponema sp.]
METRYTIAESGDYDEVIDFGNYVFSHAHSSTDFPSLLPKLYKREYFMEGIHYLAKEEGKIRALVGAYPLKLNILGETLPGRGIGMVSVHPYARSRGYMRALMDMALADMRRDGLVFACLGGLRQRYEYFGFTPAGIQIVFECRRSNIRHSLGKIDSPALKLRQLKAGDGELEEIYRLHQSKAARFERDREKLFDILSSWKNRTFALLDEKGFAGYLVYNDSGDIIQEINLKEPGRMAQAIGSFLDYQGKTSDRGRVEVCVQPHESAKLEVFSAFAEGCRLSSAYSFAVFDFPPVLSALLNLKAADQTLPDGGLDLRIGDSPIRIAVRQGKALVSPAAGGADLVLNPLQAVRLFFSALAPLSAPPAQENPFLRGLLPLPLFFETPDGI